MVVGHKKVNVLNEVLEPFTEAEVLGVGGEKSKEQLKRGGKQDLSDLKKFVGQRKGPFENIQ